MSYVDHLPCTLHVTLIKISLPQKRRKKNENLDYAVQKKDSLDFAL